MPKSAEEEEWEGLAREGRGDRNKNRMRIGASLLAAAIAAAVVFLLLAKHSDSEEREKQARLARGETVVEVTVNGTPPEVGDGIFFMAVPAAVGFGAFLVTFFALGGRLSAEYKRGLSELTKR